VAIINSKADEMGLYLSDEISSYMATRLNANVRQLEGCIKKISAYQQLMNTPPTLVQVQNIIREILSDDDIAPIGSERIINDVAQVYNLKAEDIRSKSRAKQVSTARKVAAYVIKEMTNASLMDIGADLGGRDHATVSFYINDISKQVKNDDVMRVMIEDIIMNIKKTASGT
jgi:chromosomal replication initiator protein